jgi:hypothetical protein
LFPFWDTGQLRSGLASVQASTPALKQQKSGKYRENWVARTYFLFVLLAIGLAVYGLLLFHLCFILFFEFLETITDYP